MSPDRLDVHVKKGWQDRLSITSVGSCQGLWALIMDSNPGYVSQVLRSLLSSDYELSVAQNTRLQAEPAPLCRHLHHRRSLAS